MFGKNANTNSGVKFEFTSGSAAPTGSAANNTHYVNRQSTTTPASTSISNTGTPTTQGNITTSARTSVHSSMTNSQAIFNVMLHEIGHTFGLDHCVECAQGSSIMTAFSGDCSCPSFPCDQNVPFNGDGLITAADNIFDSLQVWQDVNHNGISEFGELFPLQLVNIATLELSYKISKYTDPYGNDFRYRAKVKDMKGSQVARWMWDVYLVRAL